jgi:hypothetical protein
MSREDREGGEGKDLFFAAFVRNFLDRACRERFILTADGHG